MNGDWKNAIWAIRDRSNNIDEWGYNDNYLGYGFNYDIKDDKLYVNYAIFDSPSWGKLNHGDEILINVPFELTRETAQEYLSNMIRKRKISLPYLEMNQIR